MQLKNLLLCLLFSTNLNIDLIGFMCNVLVFYCYTRGENYFILFLNKNFKGKKKV
jgi:hypothetical protein